MNPAIAAAGLALALMLLFVGRRHGKVERVRPLPAQPRRYADPMAALDDPFPAPVAVETVPSPAPEPAPVPAAAPVRKSRIPGRLGVPGEDSDRVQHGLPEAAAYSDQKLLVIGAGDAAVDAALALLSRGNDVALVCFGPDFTGLKANTEVAVRAAMAAGRLNVHFSSDVRRFEENGVVLSFDGPAGRGEIQLQVDRSFVIGA